MATAADIRGPAALPADVPALACRHPGLLIAAVMGASIIQFLDATIANVAIPHMQTSLGATFESVTWVLTSFIIATAVATPIVGWLADRVGTRTLFLWAVGGFVVTSMACGAAQNLGQMVTFRILQGVCAALIGPLGQSIMLDVTPPSRHPRALAIFGMAVMIGPIAGPVLGGWLTENYNWRWVFYVNVPVGIPVFALLWWLLPSRAPTPRRLDITGYALFAIGLGALQLLLDRGNHADWFESWEIWIEAGVAIGALWMFVIHLATTRAPLFSRALTSNIDFLIPMVFMIGMGIVMVGLSALLPPLLQNIYGYTVIDTGLLMMPRAVGTLLTMMLVAPLMRYIQPRVMIGLGYAIGAFSLWMMTRWTLEMGPWPIIWAGFIQGLGMGFTFVPMNIIAFSVIPPHLRTEASALMNLFRNIGASAGISLITTMLARNLQTSHADLSAHITPYNMPGVDVSQAEMLGPYGEAALRTLDGLINRQAAMIAYLDDFYMMMFVIGAVVPLAFLLRRVNVPTGRPPPMSE